MVIAAYSDRIYKDKISCNDVLIMLEELNDIKINIYSDIINNKVDSKDINTTYVIEKYGINTYYANMVIKKVKEAIKSNNELQEMYIEEKETKISEKEEQIKENKEKLDSYRKLKKECINYSKGKNKEDKFIFPYKFVVEEDVVTIKTSKKTYSLYEFEVFIDSKIKRIKNTLYQNKNRLNRLKQQLEELKRKPLVSCFGTKALFKKQYTVYNENTHNEWRKLWDLKRHNNFVISGCKNHEGGSMCVRYENGNLIIMKHTQGYKKNPDSKYYKQETFSIPCNFKYNKELWQKAYNDGTTIAYQIVDKRKYFIIMATFEIESKPERLNNYLGNGIVSIDINVDCFALSDIDKHGNLLSRKVIKFDLDGLSSNKTNQVIENAVCEVFKFCSKRNKPLGREDIKSIKFKDTKNKKTNKKLTQFAYDKMIIAIDRKFYKNDYEVFKTNPQYTSQEGKIKYMALFGLSIHESASFCIGRRILFSTPNNLYYEDMGKFKKFGNIKAISKPLKKLKTKDFYRLHKIPIDVKNYKNLNTYVKDIKKYLENEALAKIEDIF